MKVRNNYTTTIGVGNLAILPDAVVELPDKYDDKHPVIAYYLSRKWLTEVGRVPKATVVTTSVVPPVNVTVGALTVDDKTTDTGEGGKTEETPSDSGEGEKLTENANANGEETPANESKSADTQEQKPAKAAKKK